MKFRLYRVLDGLGGAVCRGHVQYPDFAPDSSNVAVGFFGGFFPFFFFWSVCIFGPEFSPTAQACSYFLVLCSLFVFCCLRGVSRCKHGGTAARVPVPACLNTSSPRWGHCVHFQMIRSKMSEVKSHAQHGTLPDIESELRYT